MQSFKDRLAGMQASAKTQMEGYTPGGFSAIPDGDYVMRIKASLEETKKLPPRLTIVWCFVVDDGELFGRQVWDRTIIEDNKVGLQIARGRVEELGYEWPEDNFPLLEDIINDITDRAPHVTCRCKSKDSGEYVNTSVRIREVHDLLEGTIVGSEIPTAMAKETPEQAAQDADTVALLDFCASQKIDGITNNMSSTDIIVGLIEAEFKFKEVELTDQETELLDRLGGSALIERAPKKVVAKPLAAPAKKSFTKKK